uniref:Uncharacterized protein n=1 Tax=viral metagenome TaxID=1070528 RepID=A0A6C0C4R4_9ZZZZ
MSGVVNSLTGNEQGNQINLLGISRSQTVGGRNVSLTNDELTLKKIKLYLIEHFVEPLISRKIENVNFNTYNFSYILTKLNTVKYLDPAEIEVYEKIVIFVQETVSTYNDNKMMTSKLYRNKGNVAHFVNQLPFITLKPHYEVYNSLYGRPGGFKYDKKILNEIKNILDANPGIIFKDVEKKLNYRFNESILQMKFIKNLEKDPASRKIEYIVYEKIFDKKYHNNQYNDKILALLKEIIEEYPTYTIKSIKKHIYMNNRYWSQYFIEKLTDKKTIEDHYDDLFGKPINNVYKKNYIKLIEEILKTYPDIESEDLEYEFEFRQPIWAELLLKNQTINALLFKQNRFLPTYDRTTGKTVKAPEMTF